MSDELLSIIMAGETAAVSLEDLMSIDLTDVEEFRGGETLPEGIFEWRIKSAIMDVAEVNDKELGQKVRRARVMFGLEAIACRQVKDMAIDKDTLVGAEFNERFFIKDALKDIGRVKSFLVDIGMQGSGPLQQLLDATVGHEFVAGIKHTKDKNDTSRVYANLDQKTIKPLGGDAAAPATAKPALFGKK